MDCFRVIRSSTGVIDPLEEVKRLQNQAALAAYREVKARIMADPHPLIEAMRFSVGGNAMDIMVGDGHVGEFISSVTAMPMDYDQALLASQRIRKARRIVVLGDNCGEIVFDRLLLEVVKEYADCSVFFMTRHEPVLNDALLRDALAVGMGMVATVTDNGIEAPLPGTLLGALSREARRVLEDADLIISKGGGNYDTLSEESGLAGKVIFFFQAKCAPYRSLRRVPHGTLLIVPY